METTHEIDNFLRRQMSPDNMEVPHPDPLLVFEARQTVMMRKRAKRHEEWNVLSMLLAFLFRPARVYHVGISCLLIAGLVLALDNGNHAREQSQQLTSGENHQLSLCNNTISVISSTMLTSIPTLRN